jgi:uncharacterized phage protein (TIGR01671 family)
MESRKIKFRIWDKVDKEWTSYPPIFSSAHGKIFEFFASQYQFENLAIQQYTGLKDKNGVEIYESDILKYTFDGDSYPEEAVDKIFICEWDQNNAWFVFKEHDDNVSDAYYWLEIKGYCEVIGNIFENSNLLES